MRQSAKLHVVISNMRQWVYYEAVSDDDPILDRIEEMDVEQFHERT